MYNSVLCVFLGGGIGSVLRYVISLCFTANNSTFPVSTFIANLIGCFAIGIFYAFTAKLGWSDNFRLLLTTGICGGFTTFSTLSYESLNLFKSGCYSVFLLYIIGSILLGIASVWLGFFVVSKL